MSKSAVKRHRDENHSEKVQVDENNFQKKLEKFKEIKNGGYQNITADHLVERIEVTDCKLRTKNDLSDKNTPGKIFKYFFMGQVLDNIIGNFNRDLQAKKEKSKAQDTYMYNDIDEEDFWRYIVTFWKRTLTTRVSPEKQVLLDSIPAIMGINKFMCIHTACLLSERVVYKFMDSLVNKIDELFLLGNQSHLSESLYTVYSKIKYSYMGESLLIPPYVEKDCLPSYQACQYLSLSGLPIPIEFSIRKPMNQKSPTQSYYYVAKQLHTRIGIHHPKHHLICDPEFSIHSKFSKLVSKHFLVTTNIGTTIPDSLANIIEFGVPLIMEGESLLYYNKDRRTTFEIYRQNNYFYISESNSWCLLNPQYTTTTNNTSSINNNDNITSHSINNNVNYDNNKNDLVDNITPEILEPKISYQTAVQMVFFPRNDLISITKFNPNGEKYSNHQIIKNIFHVDILKPPNGNTWNATNLYTIHTDHLHLLYKEITGKPLPKNPAKKTSDMINAIIAVNPVSMSDNDSDDNNNNISSSIDSNTISNSPLSNPIEDSQITEFQDKVIGKPCQQKSLYITYTPDYSIRDIMDKHFLLNILQSGGAHSWESLNMLMSLCTITYLAFSYHTEKSFETGNKIPFDNLDSVKNDFNNFIVDAITELSAEIRPRKLAHAKK
ncbi:putative basic-leucine zipper transcription factor [Tieghemostelium lacteum]|uniref:Putative basic-leucine zipper transcription factor n=1 Tax=Tieghemostelium lacteum TaxID=361077 RepID=A0A151Z7J9_TIELA|nr:putative basic-leucine zipper transcription factor [Tieghemostelium lacteum]|eukprot:KYQ89939.1 putative basic-leucine zipper transcription factor [Tieghemostelium lacteum]